MNTAQKGFTLIELMIVIAIIGILAAIAIPAYQTYTNKARFTEVVLAASSIKGNVDVCYQTRGANDLTACNTEGEIGADFDGAAIGTNVDTVGIDDDAVITATSVANADGDQFTYTLTPAAADGSLTWTEGGTCIAAGLC